MENETLFQYCFKASIGKRIQKDKFKNFHKINFNALQCTGGINFSFYSFFTFFFVASSNYFLQNNFYKEDLNILNFLVLFLLFTCKHRNYISV